MKWGDPVKKQKYIDVCMRKKAKKLAYAQLREQKESHSPL